MPDKQEIPEIDTVTGQPNIPKGSELDGLKADETSLKTETRHLKYRMLKTVYYQFYRIHAFLFLLSLGVIALSLLLHVYIPILQEFAAGFLIFWMPGFCVMFLLWDSAAFRPIYLIPLILAFSQVVVITMGLLCVVLGILWTPLSILLIISGFIVGSYCIAWKFKRFRLAQPLHLKKCGTFEVFFARFTAGKVIPKNFGYLFVFMFLLGIYAIVTFPLLQGEDPWFHARILRFTLDTGIIRFDLFRGAVGLQIFASGFGLLASWDALAIAQWFPIFLVINGDLAFYLIVRRLFKNPQIANLGTFFISFTPLMYYWGVNNFWANAIAQPFGLYVLFFFFDAMARKNPATRAQKWTYIILGIYLSFILRMMHGEVFFNYWLSAAVVAILCRRNTKSQIGNIILLVTALSLFLLVDVFYPSYLLLNPALLFAVPPIYLLIIIPGVIVSFIIFKKLGDFPLSNYNIFKCGKAVDGKIFYRVEKRYLKILIWGGFILSISVVFTVVDFLPDIISVTTSLLGFVVSIEFIIAVLSAFMIQRREPIGRIIFYWGVFFLAGAGGYFAYDFLLTHTMLSNRMLLFASPGVILLGIGYLSYVLNSGNLNRKKIRRFVAYFAVSSLVVCTISYPFIHSYAKSYEISAAIQMGQGMPEDSIIITGFKWWNPIQYFAYEHTIFLDDIHLAYLFPEEGNLDRTFFYSYRDNEPNRQIYVILDSTFLSIPIHPIVGPDFGTINISQIQQYENISCFNHVYSYGTTPGDWGMIFCLV